MTFQCQAIYGKQKTKKKKNIPFRQNVVVAATFLDQMPFLVLKFIPF
jgi:hypothetical protein